MTAALRWIALGDSYTIGTAVPEADRWPDQLAARLATDPPPVTLRLAANLALDGRTSADVLRDQLPVVAADPDIGFVTLLAGVNDVVRDVPAATCRATVERLLDGLLAAVPAGRILVVETPDYTVTPMGAAFGDPATRRAAIVAANARLAEASAARGITFVDGILEISHGAAADPALVARDGLHPSGAQYRRWVVERIEPVVRTLLG